jgi:hypothetical protein
MVVRFATWPSGTSVSWRSLTWGEYKRIQSLQACPAEKALEVYNLVMISGPDPAELLAGIMMWIYQNEMTNTPFTGEFTTISRPLAESREKVKSFLYCAQAFVASVFKIPFEVIDTWDSETLLTRVAQAEFVSGVPLNPTNPNTSPEAAKKPKKELTKTQQIAVDRKNESKSYKRR